MEDNKIGEVVNSIVKDKIKQRDGYKLTGFALGTIVAQGVRLLVIHRYRDYYVHINYTKVLFYGGIILFLVSLGSNIIGQYKHRAESKKERVKNIMEMLAAIFSSYIVSTILWESFRDFISGH